MDKDKLIEKLKSAKQFYAEYLGEADSTDAKVCISMMASYRDYILTSLTAPVPDDGDIIRKAREVAKQQHYAKESDTVFFAAVWELAAKWMRDKLTKTPDAG